MAKPNETTQLWLNAGGLTTPFVIGLIHADFGKRSITFVGSNQRDGYNEFEEVIRPSDEWWEAAMTLDWPMAAVTGS